MAHDGMTLKEKNRWWKKAIGKHTLRNSNKPKAPKGARWDTPTVLNDYVPTRGSNARSNRVR